MDLFELLFIAVFILLTVLEGILRKRKKGQGQGSTEERRPPQAGDEAGRGEAPSAADMLPDDLWEMMTGERRDRAPTGGEGSPWSSMPAEASTGTVDDAAAEGESGWEPEPWQVDDEAEAFEPESLEYQGPEAYSLETPAPEPESLERPLPTPTARHRAFHEMIDRPPGRRGTVSSPLMRALRSRDGLRQAVVLKEILGPPKGLE